MNLETGDVIEVPRDDEGRFVLPRGYFPVSARVAEAQLEGQRVLATRKLRRLRKVERQNVRRGRQKRGQR